MKLEGRSEGGKSSRGDRGRWVRDKISNGRKWWSLDGRVHQALSITDMFAGCSKCRVTACNKVTFLFNWQLMKTPSPAPELHASFPHTTTVQQGAESSTDTIQHTQKGREREGEVLRSMQGAYRVKQEGDSNMTVGRASPCAVSVFRPLGGSFWAAPSSVRRCIRKKQQVNPTARAQRLQWSSFRGKLIKKVYFNVSVARRNYSFRQQFPPRTFAGSLKEPYGSFLFKVKWLHTGDHITLSMVGETVTYNYRFSQFIIIRGNRGQVNGSFILFYHVQCIWMRMMWLVEGKCLYMEAQGQYLICSVGLLCCWTLLKNWMLLTRASLWSFSAFGVGQVDFSPAETKQVVV